MNFPAWRLCGATARRLFLARVLDDADNPPWPPVSRTDAGGFGFSALCMTTGLSAVATASIHLLTAWAAD